MKNILFALVLAASTSSFAQSSKMKSNIREFSVKSVAAGQGQVSGTIKVDYQAKMVSVNLQMSPYCAPKMMCAQVIRVFQAELPIKSVQNDSCNVHTITALDDKRPVDGLLEKITIADVSDITCQTLVAVYPEATLETAYVDRRAGKTVTETTKMVLTLEKEKATQIYPLLKYQATVGFSPQPTSLTVTIDSAGQVKSLRKSYGVPAKPDVTMDVAVLSAEALKNLKQQLSEVKEDNALVDENEGQPECQDAGTVEVVALNDDVLIPVFRTSGCHTFRSVAWPATQLSQLILGLATLVK